MSRHFYVAALVVLATGVISAFAASSALAASHKGVLLSLSAPGQVSVGQSAVLQGRLTDRATHRPIRNGEVTFYYVYPGGPKWLPLATVHTNGLGYYQSTITVPAAVSFSTYFDGSRHYRATWSPTRAISIAQTIPPDGTSYWDPVNSCHYYVANRTWYGDYCVAYQTDSSGNAIKTIYNVYAFDGATSRAGAILYQFDTANPEWLQWRVPSDPEFQTVRWAAVPRNNLSAEPKLEVDFEGKWVWTTRAELQQLVATLQAQLAAEQANGQAASTNNIVTVGGASENSQALTDLVNGVDRLGGDAQLGQVASNVYSIGISEPITPDGCNADYECSPVDSG